MQKRQRYFKRIIEDKAKIIAVFLVLTHAIS